MSLHKIVVQLFDDLPENRNALHRIIGIMQDAERDFQKVGAKLTYDKFKKYAERHYSGYGYSSPLPKWIKNDLKIIKGDNLDLIEEKAKKKKLI